jgi:lambda family phage tail tape measure protein
LILINFNWKQNDKERMSLMDLETGLDPMFLVDNEWTTSESDSHSLGNSLSNLNMIILNDRLMSEAVQSEHSYFTSGSNSSPSSNGSSSAATAVAAAIGVGSLAGFSLADDDSVDSHFNGTCF